MFIADFGKVFAHKISAQCLIGLYTEFLVVSVQWTKVASDVSINPFCTSVRLTDKKVLGFYQQNVWKH